MWGTSYGSVRLGLKKVDLRGFTGRVSGVSSSSETVTTVGDDRNYSTSATYRYVSYKLTNAAGETADINNAENRHAAAKEGEVVSAYWCDVGDKTIDTLAYYNHSRKVLGIVAQARNDIAGPAGNNWMIVIALFLALFGVMNVVTGDGGSWYVYLGICVGIFVWIIRRRKKLLKLLDAAVNQSEGAALQAAVAPAK
jgi:LPXTG-motif cell wall-anchored protein